ncbi:hypothetical protein DFH09DRAFT_1299329 [Mycena vulgaris]|nr:hypothetical protein DFH09DRAFT_1299329 [Mycena vulgaris]
MAFDISLTCVYWTWANEICSGNAEERAITIAAMIGFFYFFNAGSRTPSSCRSTARRSARVPDDVRLAGTKKAKEVKSGSFSGGEEDADEKREGEVAVIPASTALDDDYRLNYTH